MERIMKVKDLARVIKKIVREEVQKEVRSVLAEQTKSKQEKLTLTEALTQNETENYPTMKTFNSADARAGFAAMQDGFGQQQAPTAFQGHSGQVVDASKIDPSVTKALTRDYSKLVQRFKK